MKIKSFIKDNIVLCIALIATVVTMFFVRPSSQYLEYINFRTLALLFCQLLIVAGLMRLSVFDRIADLLLSKIKTLRNLSRILLLLIFFLSMLVTNDVTLISFVPLTIAIASRSGISDGRLIFIIVLETVAANLGSMFTPFGNPHNLYLYNISGMGVGEFFLLMAPYSCVALVLILMCVLLIPKTPLKVGSREEVMSEMPGKEALKNKKLRVIICFILLLLCIFTVFKFLDIIILLIIVAGVFLIMDFRAFAKVNYKLLLTFIVFFILAGNIRNLPGFQEMLSEFISGREALTAFLLSQVISNVPATMLLSSFTDQYRELIVGTDLGGLGTLVASMASLISFQFYSEREGSRKGRYILTFMGVSIIFLFFLFLVKIILAI